jgi:hypothetical protein
LQQVKMEVDLLYRVPERSVVNIYQEFAGEPFDSLIAPRVQEALKEVAATQSAEQIVKNREEVKTKALARGKIGTNFLDVVDLVLYNLGLSPELEAAIELKMANCRFFRVGTAGRLSWSARVAAGRTCCCPSMTSANSWSQPPTAPG